MGFIFFPFKSMEIKLKLQKIMRKKMPAKKAHHYKEQDDVFFTLKFYCSTKDTVMI